MLGAATANAGTDRIYGKITTTDGDQYQGLIRWDRNEVSWVDQLNGTKEVSRREMKKITRDREKRESRRSTKVRIFGFEVGDNGWDWSEGNFSAETSIRFGHIKKMLPGRDDELTLILKSGDTVEMTGGSTDFGSGMRELIIEDEREGETELTWEDIEEVELLPTPANAKSELGERMYGTLTTRRGEEFTGFVAWDADECLSSDVIDGEDKGKSRKIKMSRIASIERYSSSGAEITLASGETIVLKGTNDVDNSNRGIAIEDPALGEVVVEWNEFDKLTFTPAPGTPRYEDFAGGKVLSGTVQTEEGEIYTGDIRWDADEAYTWEMLNGETRDVKFRIEFGMIKSITRDSFRESQVTLWDGRTFDLRGSNDVDESNKGIIISQPGKKDIFVDWENFKSLELSK
jgi:hypothetical protein